MIDLVHHLAHRLDAATARAGRRRPVLVATLLALRDAAASATVVALVFLAATLAGA